MSHLNDHVRLSLKLSWAHSSHQVMHFGADWHKQHETAGARHDTPLLPTVWSGSARSSCRRWWRLLLRSRPSLKHRCTAPSNTCHIRMPTHSLSGESMKISRKRTCEYNIWLQTWMFVLVIEIWSFQNMLHIALLVQDFINLWINKQTL